MTTHLDTHGRNIVCPRCSNGSKRRARQEDGSGSDITVMVHAVVAAEISTNPEGEQTMSYGEQVDLGRKRWAQCGECGHSWDLSGSVRPDAMPWAR